MDFSLKMRRLWNAVLRTAVDCLPPPSPDPPSSDWTVSTPAGAATGLDWPEFLHAFASGRDFLESTQKWVWRSVFKELEVLFEECPMGTMTIILVRAMVASRAMTDQYTHLETIFSSQLRDVGGMVAERASFLRGLRVRFRISGSSVSSKGPQRCLVATKLWEGSMRDGRGVH